MFQIGVGHNARIDLDPILESPCITFLRLHGHENSDYFNFYALHKPDAIQHMQRMRFCILLWIKL